MIKDGTLYKTLEIENVRFDIYYGYESQTERQRGWEPTPQYPDFDRSPQYTKEGFPFSLAYGGPCEHYAPIERDTDEWCAGCSFFERRDEIIGICKCRMRQKAE